MSTRITLEEWTRGVSKLTCIGEYVITKRGKPYLKVVITAAEEEKPTINMVEDCDQKCKVKGCQYDCDNTGYCYKHQKELQLGAWASKSS